MALIGTLAAGLIIGALAKLFIPGKDPGGLIITMLIGVAGAGIARFIGQTAGWYRGGEAPGYIASVIGAMLLLLAYRMVFRRHAH